MINILSSIMLKFFLQAIKKPLKAALVVCGWYCFLNSNAAKNIKAAGLAVSGAIYQLDKVAA